MLKGLLVLLSVIFIFNQSAKADKKTAEQYWAGTGLNLKFLADKLQTTCYKDAKAYVACLQGLNVEASLLKPAAVFATPAEVAQNPNSFGPAIKAYWPYTLYVYKPQDSKLSLSQRWEKTKSLRAAQLKAATDVFNSPLAAQFKFSAILLELKDQIIKGDLAGSEALLAAEIFNTILASAVDPHTHIDPVAEFNDQSNSTDQSFTGIGVVIKQMDGDTIVISPNQDGPAYKAGIKAHDIISTVNGQSVKGLPVGEVVKKIMGPEGTSVKLGITRKQQTLEIVVVRQKINVKNVQARTVNDAKYPVAYIKLNDFMEQKACQEIADAVLGLEDRGAKGLILDLRDNGGGLLNQAICIGSLFVGKQTIVQVRDFKQGQMQKYVGFNDAITKLPMVTLVNAHSASASEILAGALQDYQRSWIAGERSFGKASVQSGSEWTSSILIFNTIQRFYEPSGRTNQIVGILPDFPIDPKPDATDEDRFALREADYYTNALPSEGQPWVEPRPNEVAKIQRCVKSSGVAEAAYASQLGGQIDPDYQLLTSEAILSCQK